MDPSVDRRWAAPAAAPKSNFLSPNIAARFDNNFRDRHVGVFLGRSQVFGNVASHQITLSWREKKSKVTAAAAAKSKSFLPFSLVKLINLAAAGRASWHLLEKSEVCISCWCCNAFQTFKFCQSPKRILSKRKVGQFREQNLQFLFKF